MLDKKERENGNKIVNYIEYIDFNLNSLHNLLKGQNYACTTTNMGDKQQQQIP